MLKTCQIAVSKPNRNSLWRFGSAREQFGSPSSERQSKAAGEVLKVLRVLRVSKPNRNSLWRFGSAREQFGSLGSERQSKAAGKVLKVLRVLRVLKVLRGAENVPDSSFEAQ